MIYPGFHGATNWFSPSYSPQTQLLYVGVREEPAYFVKERSSYQPGQWFSGGNPRGVPRGGAIGFDPCPRVRHRQTGLGISIEVAAMGWTYGNGRRSRIRGLE